MLTKIRLYDEILLSFINYNFNYNRKIIINCYGVWQYSYYIQSNLNNKKSILDDIESNNIVYKVKSWKPTLELDELSFTSYYEKSNLHLHHFLNFLSE